MAKLKFDRLLNLTIVQDETITVPNGELWKYTVAGSGTGTLKINRVEMRGNIINGHVVGGAKISKYLGDGITFQVIVFKVVQE